jgi:hypothetical protein
MPLKSVWTMDARRARLFSVFGFCGRYYFKGNSGSAPVDTTGHLAEVENTDADDFKRAKGDAWGPKAGDPGYEDVDLKPRDIGKRVQWTDDDDDFETFDYNDILEIEFVTRKLRLSMNRMAEGCTRAANAVLGAASTPFNNADVDASGAGRWNNYGSSTIKVHAASAIDKLGIEPNTAWLEWATWRYFINNPELWEDFDVNAVGAITVAQQKQAFSAIFGGQIPPDQIYVTEDGMGLSDTVVLGVSSGVAPNLQEGGTAPMVMGVSTTRMTPMPSVEELAAAGMEAPEIVALIRGMLGLRVTTLPIGHSGAEVYARIKADFAAIPPNGVRLTGTLTS